MAPMPEISDFSSFLELTAPSASQERNCIWYLIKDGRRCKNAVNKDDISKALNLGASIQRASTHTVRIDQLEEYASLRCCNQARHRLMLADYGLQELLAKRWRRELHDNSPTTSASQTNPSSPSTSPTIQVQGWQDQDEPRVIQTRHRSRQSSQAESSTQQSSSTSLCSSPFRPHIVPKYQSVTSKLRDNLTASSKTGTIYLFTRSSSPGFVKIGFSKWGAQCRLRDWERSCGYKPILLAAFDDVPHMQKVEQLIHFQLADKWRVEKQCAKCCRQHREWFEIGSEVAITIAGQWVEWMREAEPYSDDGQLKDVWACELSDLEARSLSVSAGVLLDIHSRSLQPEQSPLLPVIEEIEIPETQPSDIDELEVPETQPNLVIDSVDDTEMLSDIIEETPVFVDNLTSEPDIYSSQSLSQTSTKSPSGIPSLVDRLSKILMIVRVLRRLSPDIFRLLVGTSAVSSGSSGSSMMSLASQASMVSSG